MSQRNNNIPCKAKAAIRIRCQRRCCWCWDLNGDRSQKEGRVVQIDREAEDVTEDNLVYLCLKHYRDYVDKQSPARSITPAELRRARADLLRECDATPTSQTSLTIKFDCDVADLSAEGEERILNALSTICRPGAEIEGIETGHGSDSLTFNVNAIDALGIAAAFDAGELEPLGAVNVQVDDVFDPHVTRVKIEHEHFIPILKHRIRTCLLSQVVDPKKHRLFSDFCRLIEAMYHFKYHTMHEDLKRDFMLFNPVTGPEELERFDTAQIEAAEATFLDNFFEMMKLGNFSPLKQEDYDVADEEDFLFSLPVNINYDKLDDDLITRYFNKNTKLREDYFGKEVPEKAKRVIIFRRGVGVEQYQGLLFLQKLDVLIDGYLDWLIRLPGRILGLFVKKKKSVEAPAEKKVAKAAKTRTVIFPDRFIERITPRHVTKGPFSLFRRDTIQEPTFVQLVILFRYATPKPRGNGKPAPENRSIHIKQFRDIPMADLEVVYPEKRLSVKPVDLVKLGITAIIGLVVFTFRFVLRLVTLGPVFLVVALGALGIYGAKVFEVWRRSRHRYEELVTNVLYDRSLDNDLGVIFFLMDALEEQEFKEAVLAYFFLWREGPMSLKKLDRRCEQFIKDQFGVEVDFEVDDALKKLFDEQLVTKKGKKYRPVDLRRACEILDKKWDEYFLYNNERQNRNNGSQDPEENEAS